MPAYDVLVCGAGVSGLVTATVLGQRGLRVLLVDKQREFAPIAKGELLQPRAVQVLDTLGILPRLRTRGATDVNRLACREADGAEIGHVDYQVLPEPYNQVVAHYYAEIQSTIAEGLAGAGVEVRTGARVTGLLDDSSGRIRGARIVDDRGDTEVDAALTVACDGRGSKLRSEAGLTARMARYRHRLVAFDLDAVGHQAGPYQKDEIGAYLTRRGLRLTYPMPHARTRLYIQAREDELRTVGRDGMAAWATQAIMETPALRPLLPAFPAGAHTAQPLPAWRFTATDWWRPGLALLGDAAHSVHPIAAQGMNAAIADACSLATHLTAVGSLTPAAVDRALSRYEGERRQEFTHLSRLSHDLATFFTHTTWWNRSAGRYVLRRSGTNPRLCHLLTYNLSGFAVRPFTLRDRLHQYGLPDPHANVIPALPGPALP